MIDISDPPFAQDNHVLIFRREPMLGAPMHLNHVGREQAALFK